MIIVQNLGSGTILKDMAIFWPSASLPAGDWETISTLEGYFLNASSTNDFNTARGANTHSHSVPNTNSVSAHNDHGNSISCSTAYGSKYTWNGGSFTGRAVGVHSHGLGVGITSAGEHLHSSNNTDSQPNNPPFIALQLIRALSNMPFPSGGIIMTNVTNTNPFFYLCDGSNGTPDIRGKFIKQSSTVLSTGGASSHTHASFSVSAAGDHNHSITVSIEGLVEATQVSGASEEDCVKNHRHGNQATFNSGNSGSHQHVVSSLALSIIPPYYNVDFLKANTEIRDQLLSGNIVMWCGEAVPSGWNILTSANGYFLRGRASGETLKSTGGSSSHSHTLPSLSSDGAHSHTVSHTTVNSGTNTGASLWNPGNWHAAQNHNHTISGSLSNNSAHTHSWSSASTGSASNMPLYKQIIYIVKN